LDGLERADAVSSLVRLLDRLAGQLGKAGVDAADGLVQGVDGGDRAFEQSQVSQGVVVPFAAHRALEFGGDEAEELPLGGEES
jgi:hypothetical protein